MNLTHFLYLIYIAVSHITIITIIINGIRTHINHDRQRESKQ